MEKEIAVEAKIDIGGHTNSYAGILCTTKLHRTCSFNSLCYSVFSSAIYVSCCYSSSILDPHQQINTMVSVNE